MRADRSVGRLLPSQGVERFDFTPVEPNKVDEYLSLRKIEGISDRWMYGTTQILKKYLSYVDNKIDKSKTIEYIQHLQSTLSVSTYRKRVYAIKKFLSYLEVSWGTIIKLPPEPYYTPKNVPKQTIEDTFNYFKDSKYFPQVKAIIHLGKDSGMRAEELYQLREEDIDLSSNIVHINNGNGQSTKTQRNRISFFTDDTKHILQEYINFYHNKSGLRCLFSKIHLERLFRKAPIKVKDLRKAFSQEWTRRNGNTSVKKLLMGHSLKGDVDLMHYNCQSEEDLKKIYDKIMISSI